MDGVEGPFLAPPMRVIQRRTNDDGGWQPAPVSTAEAANLQALLEAIVRRYGLKGSVVATRAGAVRARVGSVPDGARDGFEAALAGDADSLKELAEAIEGKALPRYFSQGSLDAFADLPTPDLVALFMRERADPTAQRSELQMVSDYNVAREMAAELRAGLARLGVAD
jgi:hypothetical protein